ncbi:MAG: FeoB small GTPase domain-containing protein, partial [Anaerolineaceae bacterium]|nr:FeoB small GTPase domain-containing protein [Anaerolineaceae bacterium]
MRFALIGQPNCGKSTLFNQIAGYRAETGNFSGTTVTFTESKVRILGEVVQVVDLPGTYSLAGTNPAEREVFNYLAAHSVDVIVNVLDATHVGHGLELTLELMELNCPVVVALNMLDEARREGITVNGPELEKLLGVPVMPIVASRGQGIRDLFVRTLQVGKKAQPAPRPPFTPDLEHAVQKLSAQLEEATKPLPPEAVAIKLLEGDPYYQKKVLRSKPELTAQVEEMQRMLEEKSGQEAIWLISSERHVRATQLVHSVVSQGDRRILLRDVLDNQLLHPVWGYGALVLVLYAFFQFVYLFGSLLESPLMGAFEAFEAQIPLWVGGSDFASQMLIGLVQGISGGVAIVLPFLVPFLFGLGLLEDIGYLPRVAFLMDALMHRLGLHGKA